MSVVVRMEMPENCCECQLRQEDYEMGEEFCPFTGVECLSIGRQNNCPIICSLPEGHGRLIDADEMARKDNDDFLEIMEMSAPSTVFATALTDAHTAIQEMLKNAPPIVPAEAERRET